MDYAREILLITTFVLYHKLKGDASFWKPYINMMDLSDPFCDWPIEDIAEFMDSELKMDAELFKSELETIWIQIEPVLQRNPQMFPFYTKESFLRLHYYVATHCFGYPEAMPSTMAVPLADMINCLPTDTSYDVYSKQNNPGFVSNKKIDSSSVYVKEFKEGLLDTYSQDLIQSKSEGKRKTSRVSRENRIEEIRF